MKFIIVLAVVFSLNSYAVDFVCYDIGLKKVLKYLEYEKPDNFFDENDVIFLCKSKEVPHREIIQWGDGSGLVGVEFEVRDGKCVTIQEPYTGQDDGDLDIEWAKRYCQDWE